MDKGKVKILLLQAFELGKAGNEAGFNALLNGFERPKNYSAERSKKAAQTRTENTAKRHKNIARDFPKMQKAIGTDAAVKALANANSLGVRQVYRIIKTYNNIEK